MLNVQKHFLTWILAGIWLFPPFDNEIGALPRRLGTAGGSSVIT